VKNAFDQNTGKMISFALGSCLNQGGDAIETCCQWLMKHWADLPSPFQTDFINQVESHIWNKRHPTHLWQEDKWWELLDWMSENLRVKP
jgi:hypothetical protein